ncbi:MAG: hypothetical protein WDN04_00495 [Rhodospirillales bacterium]
MSSARPATEAVSAGNATSGDTWSIITGTPPRASSTARRTARTAGTLWGAAGSGAEVGEVPLRSGVKRFMSFQLAGNWRAERGRPGGSPPYVVDAAAETSRP